MTGTLIHLGAGFLTGPSIRAAQAAGLRVLAVDTDPEAPGRYYADAFVRANPVDSKAVLDVAEEVPDLAGLYCGSDAGLATVARLSTRLNLPGPDVDALSPLLDRVTANALWKEAGLPALPAYRVANLDEAEAVLQRIGGPAMLMGSRRTDSHVRRRVTAQKQLAAAWAAVAEYREPLAMQPEVTGRQIDANACLVEGALVPCGLMARYFTLAPLHVSLWGMCPAAVSAAEEEQVYLIMARAAAAAGLRAGPVKANVLLTAAGPKLVDFAPRLQSEIASNEVAPIAQGWHPALPWFHHLAGTEWQKPPEAPRRQAAAGRLLGWRAVLCTEPGRFLRVEGVDTAANMTGVLQVLVARRNGQFVPAGTDNRAVIAYVVAEGGTAVQLKTRLSAAAGIMRPIIAVPDRMKV